MITMFDLISHVETKDATSSLRFEPATFEKALLIGMNAKTEKGKILTTIRDVHTLAWGTQCSWGTARALYSSSFGAVQVMGFNLWGSLLYRKTVTEYLASPTDQRLTFDKFLQVNNLTDYKPELLAVNTNARLKFSKTYNGSVDYAEHLILALKHFGYAIK